MNKFNHKWENISYTALRLKLEGSIDRSIDPEKNEDIKKLRAEVEANFPSKLITIDVNKLTFWDTEGIHAIIGKIVIPLSKKGARIGFYGKRFISNGQPTQIYDDARLKYEDILSGRILWEDSEEKLIELLRAAR